MVIGLERNQQSESEANQTKIRVLKNRFSGETGLASTLFFDNKTGRLNETDTQMFSTNDNNDQTMGENHPF